MYSVTSPLRSLLQTTAFYSLGLAKNELIDAKETFCCRWVLIVTELFTVNDIDARNLLVVGRNSL